MRQCISVRRRQVKIVHLKLFSVHSDDVSFGVPRRRLLMQHLDLSLDDLILSISICSEQVVNVPKHLRKIVQVEPKQGPGDDEHRAEPAFCSVISPLKNQRGHASNQGGEADEQSKNFARKNAVAVSASDLRDYLTALPKREAGCRECNLHESPPLCRWRESI